MYYILVEMLQPYPLLLVAAVGATANLWRRRVESRRRLLLLTLPLLGLLFVSTPAVSYLCRRPLERNYPPGRAGEARAAAPLDSIVVLSSGAQRSEHLPGGAVLAPDSLVRCLRAADLYHALGGVPLVVSGGIVDTSQPGPSLADLMRAFLVRHGVDEQHVLVEDRSRSTYENAVYSAELLRSRHLRRPALVTTASHLPRAVGCFTRQGIDVLPVGCDFRTLDPPRRLLSFWPNPSAAASVQASWHEGVGLALYAARGRTGEPPAAAEPAAVPAAAH